MASCLSKAEIISGVHWRINLISKFKLLVLDNKNKSGITSVLSVGVQIKELVTKPVYQIHLLSS